MDIVQRTDVCARARKARARLLLKLLCVKAVARWQCVKSRSPPLLFIKAAFAGRLFTQFNTMHKLVLSFFILSKAFRVIDHRPSLSTLTARDRIKE